ncbi:MAG: hypothetical protein NTV34_20060 [Proteobacteria bacterium]|nr:hypothetical protein [Pseudomonadota bacterium]
MRHLFILLSFLLSNVVLARPLTSSIDANHNMICLADGAIGHKPTCILDRKETGYLYHKDLEAYIAQAKQVTQICDLVEKY